MTAPTSGPLPLKTIDEFRARSKYTGDQTRVDLAYALYALSKGAAESDVRSAIGSRDLSHKGNERRQEVLGPHHPCRFSRSVARPLATDEAVEEECAAGERHEDVPQEVLPARAAARRSTRTA